MQDILQTPFKGYKNKEDLIKSIKYFVEKYENEYIGLMYTEINIQNYLGLSITKKIIEKVRSKYPKVEEEDIWKGQRENLDYSNLLSAEEVDKIVKESSNDSVIPNQNNDSRK